LDTFPAVLIQGKPLDAKGAYLWQQEAPLPDISGLRYGIFRDIPRRISSVPSRNTQTGMVFTSLRRSEVGTRFPERLMASIIGTVTTALGV